MKIGPRYLDRVDNYLLWARCTTPMDLMLGQGLGDNSSAPVEVVDPIEALFRRETYGENINCPNPYYHTLSRGKANRDWWTKEKGWWDKNASYVAEQFLTHLTIPTFQELFEPWWPRVHMIRWLFDNGYSASDWERDALRYYKFGLEVVPDGLRIVVAGAA